MTVYPQLADRLRRIKRSCGHSPNGDVHYYLYRWGCDVCVWLNSLRSQLAPYVLTDEDSGDVLIAVPHGGQEVIS